MPAVDHGSLWAPIQIGLGTLLWQILHQGWCAYPTHVGLHSSQVLKVWLPGVASGFSPGRNFLTAYLLTWGSLFHSARSSLVKPLSMQMSFRSNSSSLLGGFFILNCPSALCTCLGL